MIGHPPEGVLDDDRRVAAHAQLQKEDVLPLVAAEERLVAAGGGVPAVVLHKGAVRPQVHGHGRAADRAVRDQPGRDRHPESGALRQLQRAVRADHKALGFDHPANDFFIVVGLLMAGP